MFERFNEKARRVIFFAQHEAIERCQPAITVEDMLLATLRVTTTELGDQYDIDHPSMVMEQIRDTLPVAEREKVIDIPLSPEVNEVLREAVTITEIHVTPWLLLWVLYPQVNPQVLAILQANGITRESLTEKKLV